MNDTHLKALQKIVGKRHVTTKKSELETYGVDWTKFYKPKPCAVAFPSSTDEISKILTYCTKESISVVPSGGRTGLAGAAVAKNNELVVSLNRLNKIISLDTVGLTIEVEAGVTTQAVQEEAEKAGLFFPLNLGAKGTSQIGGNIATNTGGLRLIRYGGMREQVLGFEVVLPDGQILDINTSLRKNNTGYDLKQLFIGAEGTLGIVTKATLKLMPPPGNVEVCCLASNSFSEIPKILEICNFEGVRVSAFEFFTQLAHEIVLEHSEGAKTPFEEKTPFYLLLEIEGEGDCLERLLEKLFEKELITNGVVASSSTQEAELWGLRENITESINARGNVRKNDVALPVNKLSSFISDLETLLKDAPKEIEIVLFGHIGDGNIHVNYVCPQSIAMDEFEKIAHPLEQKIFALVSQYRGSISAEHGVGLVKKDDLHFSCSELEIKLMRSIKNTFDPSKIMNPGKIFD